MYKKSTFDVHYTYSQTFSTIIPSKLLTGEMISSGKFQQYDYGITGNKEKYNSLVPPKYDLSKITAPVHVYYSENDWLANTKVRIFLYI